MLLPPGEGFRWSPEVLVGLDPDGPLSMEDGPFFRHL